MKLHVTFSISDLSVDDVIEGDGVADITHKAKLAIAERLGFLAGAFVRSMPDLEFAREVVRRYNGATGADCTLPPTVDRFVEWAIERKLASAVD